MSPGLQAMAAVWRQFVTAELYDAGFSEPVNCSRADRAELLRDAVRACAYMKGAADMARLANTYMTPKWKIAHTVSALAGTFCGILYNARAGEDVDPDQVAYVFAGYRERLLEFVGELKGTP